MIKLTKNGWSMMTIDERSSFLDSVILTLTMLGLLTIFIATLIEHNTIQWIDQYPLIIRGCSLMIFLLGGIMIIMALLISIWHDIISHWDGLE